MAATTRRQAVGRRQTCHGAGDGGERHGDGGDSTSVGSYGRGGKIVPGHVGQGLGDTALHGVAGHYVTRRLLAQVLSRGEKPGMLARTVVGQRRGRVPSADPRLRRFPVHRSMCAAFQIIRRETDALQPCGDSHHVLRRAVMGGAGQGDFAGAEGKALGGARFDQRKGLQGLDC